MTFVVVPRDAMERYVDGGWSAMLAAAREGVDGLRVIEEKDPKSVVRVIGCAVFRDGVTAGFSQPDTAALHAQGWGLGD